ncbi:hypothetical protein [Aminobacter sp. HY435]|uniref:hypothetical protein n=1 Tax=Aminobacter sp. HY435 TaxID=2970917 RepID=UPI0022B9C042|nr:hypothetical protein [Aminobacter sp. HY435]
MRTVSYIAVFIGGLVVCYLLLSLGVVDAVDGLPGPQEEPSLSLPTYLSFLSVMLTAVTAVLAAVAIGIGVVAFYTIPGLKTEATNVAQKAAEKTAREVSEEALAEVKIRKMIVDLNFKVIKDLEQEKEWGNDPMDETR